MGETVGWMDGSCCPVVLSHLLPVCYSLPCSLKLLGKMRDVGGWDVLISDSEPFQDKFGCRRPGCMRKITSPFISVHPSAVTLIHEGLMLEMFISTSPSMLVGFDVLDC